MNERLNEIIEDTLADNYFNGISEFMEKMDKKIEPSVEVCRKMFFRTNSGDNQELFQTWERVKADAKKRAARAAFEI